MNIPLHQPRFDNRKFAFQVIKGFITCAICWFLLFWFKYGYPNYLLFASIITAGLIFSLLSLNYYLAKLLHKLFSSIWKIFQLSISILILTFFFYLILTPFGILRRLFFTKNSSFALSKSQPSYWIDQSEAFDPQRYYRQF